MSTTTTQTTQSDPRAPAGIEGLQRHGYLFGQHLANSYSPYLHDVIYSNLGLPWGQVRLDSSDINLFLDLVQHPDFYGASVTMPNKVAIIPHLDEMTDECRDTGACNTLYIREDPATGRRKLCGAQTDVIGIRDSFVYNVEDLPQVVHNKPALVIGGGGAARSAVYALRKWLKVTDIYLVNRDPAEVDAVVQDCRRQGYGDGLVHVATAEQAKSLAGPGAIVACVPDFEPTTPEEKLAREITNIFLDKSKGAMLEMCYNPTPFTKLGSLAESKGWQVILGTEALIWQGIEQDRYWTGKSVEELPVEEVKAAIANKVAQSSKQKL